MKKILLNYIAKIKDENLLGLDDSHVENVYPNISLEKHTKEAFFQLKEAAKKDGINLYIASGYRSFARQKLIWEKKFQGKVKVKDSKGKSVCVLDFPEKKRVELLLNYSFYPGATRHHFGTDIDIYAKNMMPKEYELKLEEHEYANGGIFYPLTLWLDKNAHKFGFERPYPKGHKKPLYEPWHFSFMPVAKLFSLQFSKINLKDFKKEIDFLGFEFLYKTFYL